MKKCFLNFYIFNAKDTAQHLPFSTLISYKQSLMVRTTGLKPTIVAGTQARIRFEMKIRHFYRWVFLSIQHLALGYNQSELFSYQVHKGCEGGRPWFCSEYGSWRVIQSADAQFAIGQPDRLIIAGHFPVPFAHVAYQHRLALEIHGIHLGKVGITIQQMA